MQRNTFTSEKLDHKPIL
uniref:Uncharacterized protein n=1 Tax=Anguilla anguilla TaxID=7936 RepID=A0A0E9SFZ1_ANGAN